MLTRIKGLLASPVFEDEDKTRIAGLVNAFLLIILAGAALFPLAAILVQASVSGPTIHLASGAVIGIVIGLLVLLRRGYVRLTGLLLSLAVWGGFTAPIYAFDGIRDTAMTGYFLTLVMVSLMMGGRALFSLSLLSTLSTVGVFFAERNGIITTSISNPLHPIDLVTVLITLGSTAALSHITVRNIAEGYERARRNQRALTESTRELQESRAALKEHAERLTRRANQLEAAAEVGRAATTIMDTDQLLHEAVELIRRRFGLSHVGLFLVDETGEWSVLRAAAGEGSCQMPVGGHRLRVDDTSVIGRVTSLGVPCIASDMESGASAFDHQHIGPSRDRPQPHSEMALPLRARRRIIGALAVQSAEPEAFTDEDLAVFQIMTDQIAVAIENARLYRETQHLAAFNESIIHSMAEGIVVEDPEGIFTFVNPAAAEMLGYAADELVGLHWTAITPPEQQPVVRVANERRTRGETDHYELELVRKDGGRTSVLVSGSPRFDTDGHFAGTMAVFTDITGRKQAQEALRESERQKNLILNSTAEMVAYYDKDLRVIWANRASAESVGKSPEELVGLHCYEIWQQSGEPCPDCPVLKACDDKAPRHSEQQTPDGRYWFLRGYPILDEEGQVIALVEFGQDITERKRAEQQMQRYAAELEQVNQELRRFTYVASHNLRGPLVNLKGFAAELRAALAVVGSATVAALPHLDKKQRQKTTTALERDVPEALTFIDASASELDRLVNAIQKLSRLNQRKLHLTPVDVDALVRASVRALSSQTEQHHTQITVGPLPSVVADRTSMEQIWSNLLSNAVKYLDPDRPGKIEIAAERADIADIDRASADVERASVPDRLPDRPSDCLPPTISGRHCLPDCLQSTSAATTFHIRDNGRGIAAEDMDKVFAPFRRAGRQDVPGEGMGLAYVQALVRRHGGRIWCESEPGVGSTFSFTIPNHRAEDWQKDMKERADRTPVHPKA